jgi:DinB superfamily
VSYGDRVVEEPDTPEEIRAYLTRTEQRLLEELERSREILDLAVPGRWTIGQIARHLIRSEVVMYPLWTVAPKLARWPRLMQGMDRANTALWHLMGMRTTEPPSTQRFSAYATQGRLRAPLFLRPSARPADYAKLIETRQRVRARTLAAVAALDEATLGRVRWSHPEMGSLTLLEMFRFLGIHEEHHLPQIQRIRAAARGAGG